MDPLGRCRVWGSNRLWCWICFRCVSDQRTPPGGIRTSLVEAGDAARTHRRLVHRRDRPIEEDIAA